MKRKFILLTLLALAFVPIAWLAEKSAAADADDKPGQKPAADEPRQPATISHDTNGDTVIHMSADAQKVAGIAFTPVASGQWSVELKGFGRVLDPAPLLAMENELASDEAAWATASNELTRLKTLSGQGNASARNLQSAEAAATQSRLAAEAVTERLAFAWGTTISQETNVQSLTQDLLGFRAALLRVDLPAGVALEQMPTGARIVTLAGVSADAEYLGTAPSAAPETQGLGMLFLCRKNSAQLVPGQSVIGYLQMPGAPLSGAMIPRDAVVRTEGKGWIYEASKAGDAFTRVEIPLDRPTEGGWFVTNCVSAGDNIVTTGAQTLLSEEMKASIQPD